MADKTIQDLTEVTTLVGGDFLALRRPTETDVNDRDKKIDVDNLFPAGQIIAYAGTTVPTGFLDCDGTAVSRTTYARLFSAIGEIWGAGDTTTTFNLPDLRGGFLRGTGSHGTETMADGNAFTGPNVGSFENDQFQGHFHEAYDTTAPGGLTAVQVFGVRANISSAITLKNVREAITDGTNGTPRAGDETRPFNAGIKYIIRI